MKSMCLMLLCIGVLFAMLSKGEVAFAFSDTPQDSIRLGNKPLNIERDEFGEVYYWIDNDALDLCQVDYSGLYETYMTPIEGQLFEDCTRFFIEGKLLLEQAFVKEPSMQIKQLVIECTAKCGEKVSIRRFTRYEMGEGLEKKVDNFAEEINAAVASMKK